MLFFTPACKLVSAGIAHILIVFEEAVIYTPARGGKQLSEVLLADPETSVFRVCY